MPPHRSAHYKRQRVTPVPPDLPPPPNTVTVGATARVSNFRPGLALVGGNTLRTGGSTAIAAATTVMGQCCMDVIVHANGFGQRGDLWPTQATPTANWNWSTGATSGGPLDGRITAINDAGCRAYVMIGNPAPWVYPTTALTDLQLKFWPNANAADANTFATALATRYVPGGAFGNGVYGYCLQNEFKGLNGVTPWRYVDFTTIYNGMYAAVKAVNAGIKMGGPYTPTPSRASGEAGYVSNTSSPVYVPLTGGETADSRALDSWVYWYANKSGADFVCHDGAYRTNENLTAWIIRQGVNPATQPIMWAEMYAGGQDDPYFSATPTTKEKALRLIHNMINAAYAGSGPMCVWGGDEQSATPFPENALWTHATGVITNTGTWMKIIKDNFADGVTLKTVTTNNTALVGIASATKLMILNRGSADLLTSTPGGTVTLPAQSVTLQ